MEVKKIIYGERKMIEKLQKKNLFHEKEKQKSFKVNVLLLTYEGLFMFSNFHTVKMDGVKDYGNLLNVMNIDTLYI